MRHRTLVGAAAAIARVGLSIIGAFRNMTAEPVDARPRQSFVLRRAWRAGRRRVRGSELRTLRSASITLLFSDQTLFRYQAGQIARPNRGYVPVPVGIVAFLCHLAEDEGDPGAPRILVGAVERRVFALHVAIRPTISEPEREVRRIIDLRGHRPAGQSMVGNGKAGVAQRLLVPFVIVGE